MTATFNNSGEEAIHRELNLKEEGCLKDSSDDVAERFELNECVSWITEGQYKKVALQFPDELLQFAPAVAGELKQLLGFVVYILADTTFSSCCVDEVAAEHIGADAVIHFGRTCLSPSERLPVLYILSPRIKMDVEQLLSAVSNTIENKNENLILVYDTRCYYAMDKLYSQLKIVFAKILISHLDLSSKEPLSVPDHEVCCNFMSRKVLLPIDDDINNYNFIYIGPKSPTLTCLAMKYSDHKFYHIDPKEYKSENFKMVKQIMNRSSKLEQIKDANIIGILMGTLGKANYKDIVKRLKLLIKLNGKKCYLFVIGKPNEAKVSNLPEVDAFVYVACPETSLFERSIDPLLYKKLVTPWEVEVALNPNKNWSLSFELDFKEFLPNGSSFSSIDADNFNVSTDGSSVSLLSNKTQVLGIREETSQLNGVSGPLVERMEGTIAPLHVGGGGELLTQRTWKGLDPDTPSEYPMTIVQGRSGIASKYVDEPTNN